MKKTSLILILGIILNTALLAQTSVNYPMKRGSIAYTMSMMGSNSPITIYFDDNGNKQCTETKMEMFGTKMHNRSITKNNKFYNLDMTLKTYTESELLTGNSQKMNFYSTDEALTKEGATKIGDEEFLGKNCQVYSMNKDGADIKLWVWQGLMLKMETSAQGMTMSMIATTISESAPDAALFEIPSDFTKK